MRAVRATVDREAALARLRAVEAHAVDGCTAERLAHGCALVDLLEDGQAVGAMAVDVTGDEAVITAAASTGDPYEQLRQIEQALQRVGVKRVRLLTRRPGLVRQLGREGYSLASAEMTKEL